MRRTPHFHLLDSADGDWSAHLEMSEAKAVIHRAVADSREFYDEPMQEDEFNIVASGNWCADQEPACYFDRDQAMLRHLRETPEWSPTFDDDDPPPIYRIDGRRVPRWRLACAMTTDEAQALWPTAGHPVALHTWRHDLIMADSRLCACTTRQHRKKGCPIGPNGRGCQMCGALYEDYGNVQSYCRPCEHWREQREIYLANWAAQRLQGASATQQLALV